MKEDYLWDGSGEPDPEVQRLEKVLGRYRHNRAAPSFEHVVEVRRAKTRPRFFNFRFSFQLAAVGAALLLAAAIFVSFPFEPAIEPGLAWDVARLEGAPRVGSKAIRGTTAV